eukprot:gene5310-5545_t
MRKLQQDLQSPTVQNAPTDDFAAAPSCGALPNAKAVPDQAGRLWGWVDGHTCAYKDAEGHVLFAINFQPGRWLSTPACIAQPFPNNSVADSRFKVLLAFSAAEGDNVAADTGSESLTRDNNTEAAQNTSQSPPGGYTSVGRIGNAPNLINAGMPNSMVKAAPLNQADASLQDLPLGWCNGGPGGLAPPNHRSRSMIDCGLRLPESRTSPPPMSFGISEGANSIPMVDADDKLGLEPTNYGLAGPTLPSSKGLVG